MITWISRLITSVLGMKVFMSSFFMTVLGIIAYNLVVDIVEEVSNFALTQIQGQSLGPVGNPTISGFAAWFLATIKAPECISMIITCVALRFVLRKIPFLRW